MNELINSPEFSSNYLSERKQQTNKQKRNIETQTNDQTLEKKKSPTRKHS